MMNKMIVSENLYEIHDRAMNTLRNVFQAMHDTLWLKHSMKIDS